MFKFVLKVTHYSPIRCLHEKKLRENNFKKQMCVKHKKVYYNIFNNDKM